MWKTKAKPVACMNAKAMVRYLAVWVSFFCPTAPCSRHSSNLGITTPSSWMMISAVMYGMIPSPNTAKRVRAPPEKRLRKPRTPPLPDALSRLCSALKSMPGSGTQQPNR